MDAAGRRSGVDGVGVRIVEQENLLAARAQNQLYFVVLVV
jgi:hypothetical protein